jgi:hypothetical protein
MNEDIPESVSMDEPENQVIHKDTQVVGNKGNLLDDP